MYTRQIFRGRGKTSQQKCRVREAIAVRTTLLADTEKDTDLSKLSMYTDDYSAIP